jgi:hypothetical protein
MPRRAQVICFLHAMLNEGLADTLNEFAEGFTEGVQEGYNAQQNQ